MPSNSARGGFEEDSARETVERMAGDTGVMHDDVCESENSVVKCIYQGSNVRVDIVGSASLLVSNLSFSALYIFGVMS